MVEAGLSISEALNILSNNKNKSMAKLAQELASKMKTGKTMSSGLRKYLAPEEYAILAAQETTGNIIEGIKRYKKLKQIKSKAKGSFISAFGYPTFVISFMIGVIYILGSKVSTQLIGVVGKAKFKQTPLYFYYEMSKPQVILLIVLIIVGIFGGLFLFTFKAIGNY
ncbi:MAG: type II secretion system F family protein, partial [Thermoproteota archaeon]